MINPSEAEPEDLISNAKYLLELVQMDLNIPRKETIPARVAAALANVVALEKIYPMGRHGYEAALMEKEFIALGWSKVVPNEVGLYAVTSAELDYFPNYVAVVEDGGKLFIHDSLLPKRRRVDLYWSEQELLVKKLA